MPRHVVRTVRGTKTHSPSTTCTSCIVEGVTTTRDATSTLKDQGQKRSEATCVMRIFQSVSRHRSTMMTKPAPVFGWKIIALHVGRVGQTTTYSSCNSSTFTYPTRLGPGWTTYRETSSTIGRISIRSSPGTSMAHMCNPYDLKSCQQKLDESLRDYI
jgi:hypothetical protein